MDDQEVAPRYVQDGPRGRIAGDGDEADRVAVATAIEIKVHLVGAEAMLATARCPRRSLRECTSPHMVKLGPIGLSFETVNDQQLVFFSEEFIIGSDLKTLLQRDGRFAVQQVAKLGRQMALAIKTLWAFGKIHRDIKPANIMRRDQGSDYVLLDAGLAFDIDGESISVGPVGTPAYFSPEQFEFTNRRTVLDFRSDMFSLGVTMYFLATAQHPFWSPGDTSQSLYSKITGIHPTRPSSLVSGFPETLDGIIMRLLGKSPHLRYRTCDQLITALQGA